MKRFLSAILSFALFSLIIGMAGPDVQAITGLPLYAFVIAASAIFLILCIAFPRVSIDGVQCAVQVELWTDYIINRLRKINAFLQSAYNDDQYVLAGKVVHIPQPGAKPAVVKNRSSYPATAVQRTDTTADYSLDVYTTDPTHIVDADKYELSYDKMDDVLGDHVQTLADIIGDDMLIKWAGSTPPATVSASGSATANYLISGQTGTRKMLKADDVRLAQLKMNLQNIPAEDRYLLLEAGMQDALLADLANTQYRDFSQYADAARGIIGKLYGFNILARSSVLVLATGGTTNALGAAVAATDNVASLAWHKSAVTRALGETKLFQNENDPLYYGDIYSALVRMGGRQRRSAGEGVIAIVAGA